MQPHDQEVAWNDSIALSRRLAAMFEQLPHIGRRSLLEEISLIDHPDQEIIFRRLLEGTRFRVVGEKKPGTQMRRDSGYVRLRFR